MRRPSWWIHLFNSSVAFVAGMWGECGPFLVPYGMGRFCDVAFSLAGPEQLRGQDWLHTRILEA